MHHQLKVRVLVMALALGASSACYRSARPRGDVEYVIREPPHERLEVATRSPGAEYIWIKGHWAWRRNDYEWVPGRWALPEGRLRVWEEGRWEHDRAGWYYVEGHWR